MVARQSGGVEDSRGRVRERGRELIYRAGQRRKTGDRGKYSDILGKYQNRLLGGSGAALIEGRGGWSKQQSWWVKGLSSARVVCVPHCNTFGVLLHVERWKLRLPDRLQLPVFRKDLWSEETFSAIEQASCPRSVGNF